jgi:hypothetical protein
MLIHFYYYFYFYIFNAPDYVFGSSSFLLPIGSQQQFEERLRQNGILNGLAGAYESSDKISRSYASLNSRSSDPYGRFSVAGSDTPDVLVSTDIIKFENPDLSSDGCIEDATSSVLNSLEEGSGTNIEGSKRRRIDKHGTKKKIQALFRQVEDFAEILTKFNHAASKSLASRISLCSLTTLLEDLSNVSSCCESSLELTTLYPQLRLLAESMQVARKLHSKILDTVHRAYIWNAEIDFPKYGDKILDGCDSESILQFFETKFRVVGFENSKVLTSDFEESNHFNELISALVSECQSSPIKLEEESVLINILSNTENWKIEAVSLLSGSHRQVEKNNISKKKKGRGSEALDTSIPTRLLSSVHSAFRLPLILLDGLSFLKVLRMYTSYIKAHHEISDFLYFSAIVKNNREFGYRNPLVISSAQSLVSSDVPSASMNDVEDKSYLKSRFDLDSRRLQVEKLKVDFDFVLPGLSDMEIIVETGEKYRDEVLSLDATVFIFFLFLFCA